MPLSFHLITPEDQAAIKVIALWLWNEWEIPSEKVVTKLSSPENIFHLVLKDGDKIVATGGLHNRVSISELTPEFNSYSPWLAWVYTDPEYRGKGYAALICEKIQEMTMERGYTKMYLFTYSAESLYRRLGWQSQQRFFHRNHDNVLMTLEL